MIEQGPSKLTDATQISRMQELRELVRTDSGRLEARQELTARMLLICEAGFSHLAQQQQDGVDIWAGGIIRRLASYTAESRRLLETFQDNEPRGSASSIIANMVDHEQNDTT